jgi:hypothetical protein
VQSKYRILALATLTSVLLTACATGREAPRMGFFVTSTNPGQGANFGGLEGADRHCQALATAAGAGAGGKTWRAYLSTTATPAQAAVNARDRIGRGPWHNFKGERIAASLDELHGSNGLNKQTALTERGQIVSGRGDAVNVHDILTGSTPEGRAATAATDTTCRNWTSSTDGAAIVGHHDRVGLTDTPAARSWNSSHPSRGCSMDALRSSGGGGLLYCFAVN